MLMKAWKECYITNHTIKLAKKRGKEVTVPEKPDPDMPEHLIPEHSDWKIPIVEVFNLLIILEVKFQTYLNSDAFKNMEIKPPMPCAPRPPPPMPKQEERELTPEELKEIDEKEELELIEKTEELGDPMAPMP